MLFLFTLNFITKPVEHKLLSVTITPCKVKIKKLITKNEIDKYVIMFHFVFIPQSTFLKSTVLDLTYIPHDVVAIWIEIAPSQV